MRLGLGLGFGCGFWLGLERSFLHAEVGLGL